MNFSPTWSVICRQQSRSRQSSVAGPAEGHQSQQSSFTAPPLVAPPSRFEAPHQRRARMCFAAFRCLYRTRRPVTVSNTVSVRLLHIFIYYIFRNKHATELNRHLLFTMAKDLSRWGSGGPTRAHLAGAVGGRPSSLSTPRAAPPWN